jgi:hypothetical protein
MAKTANDFVPMTGGVDLIRLSPSQGTHPPPPPVPSGVLAEIAGSCERNSGSRRAEWLS